MKILPDCDSVHGITKGFRLLPPSTSHAHTEKSHKEKRFHLSLLIRFWLSHSWIDRLSQIATKRLSVVYIWLLSSNTSCPFFPKCCSIPCRVFYLLHNYYRSDVAYPSPTPDVWKIFFFVKQIWPSTFFCELYCSSWSIQGTWDREKLALYIPGAYVAVYDPCFVNGTILHIINLGQDLPVRFPIFFVGSRTHRTVAEESVRMDEPGLNPSWIGSCFGLSKYYSAYM